MEPLQELLPGAWALALRRFPDERGCFVKTCVADDLARLGLPFALAEQYVTRSHRGVIRGMHFQVPPHDHVKLVTCLSGAVTDVLLDLRPGPSYGRVASFELSEDVPVSLYLPSGVAHGFVSRSEGALMLYATSTVHAPTSDGGVRWDSFGFDWGSGPHVLSERDRRHPLLVDFQTPFPVFGDAATGDLK